MTHEHQPVPVLETPLGFIFPLLGAGCERRVWDDVEGDWLAVAADTRYFGDGC